jgi:oligoendopeptidase F
MKTLANMMRLPPVARPLVAAALSLSLCAPTSARAETEGLDGEVWLTASPAAAPSGAGAATDPRYVWDLSTLFRDDAAWEAERQALLPALGGARPVDCMESAEGRALVESVVLRMQSGAYS